MSDDEGNDFALEAEPNFEDDAEPAGDEGPGEPGDDSSEGDDAASGSDTDDDATSGVDAAPEQKASRRTQQRADMFGTASVETLYVDDEDRTTDGRLQLNEAANALAIRAQQIADFATHYGDSAGKHSDPVQIAYEEFYLRKSPLILHRRVGTTADGRPIVERWTVRHMTLPALPPPPSK